MRNTWALLFLVPTIVAPIGGCSTGPGLGKVTGTVTLDDKPLASGSIRFEASGARPASGRIENGQIVEVTTHKPGDGAPVGSHKVAIAANAEAASAVVVDPGKTNLPGANYMSGRSLIPTRYNDPSTSELTAEIKPGANSVVFKLSSK